MTRLDDEIVFTKDLNGKIGRRDNDFTVGSFREDAFYGNFKKLMSYVR